MLRLIRQRGDRDGRLTSKRLRTVRATSHSTVRRCRCEESGRRRSKDAPRHRAYWYMRDGEQPEILRRYFVAHVAQISRGNAQANAVNSTDLVWSRLVRDQEVGGSNPLAPTTFLQTNQTVTATSCSTTTLGLGSLGSIETGTSKPTPQRFTTSLRNATSFLIWS